MNYKNLPITSKKLGMFYSKERTSFRVWSPLRELIRLALYSDGFSHKRKIYRMKKYEDGVHELTIEGDLKGNFYTFLIEDQEITDPYSYASSANSIRSAIINLEETNPKGWSSYKRPGKDSSLPIIYEVHIKDFTFDKSSMVSNRGKYLGFIEEMPLDHLKELGVSHIHFMPIFDFLTVEEEGEVFMQDTNYNWGYDPELFNVPEGSYSSNSKDPLKRIGELKSLIMGLHKAGFKIIMDVVYNHTYRSKDSNFNIIMPDYYYRQNADGELANGSGCGNEIATERPMVRKFIIDSLKYWLNEYHLDGFRFDLMSLIDMETVKEIVKELKSINPDILIYGEPWLADSSPLPEAKRTMKGSQKNQGFALFNDVFRDAIKGDNDGEGKGFIQGNFHSKLELEKGIVGSIDYDSKRKGFTSSPLESINYINSHDNLIIRDKIKKSLANLNETEEIRLNKLAFSILFTSQGIVFFHAGNEFLRTKNMEKNSYNLPLRINGIDWSLKEKYYDYFKYFKDLIYLRKSYREFNIEKAEDIRRKIKFINGGLDKSIIAYTISRENESYLLIIHNGAKSDHKIESQLLVEHLRENYKLEKDELLLKVLLDENGIVENMEYSNYEEIKIPFLTTIIYIIK